MPGNPRIAFTGKCFRIYDSESDFWSLEEISWQFNSKHLLDMKRSMSLKLCINKIIWLGLDFILEIAETECIEQNFKYSVSNRFIYFLILYR